MSAALGAEMTRSGQVLDPPGPGSDRPPPGRQSNGRAVWAIAAAHAALTTVLAARLGVWVDEAYTLHTTSRGPAEALSRALSFELQPPAYFVALALWRTASSSVLFARLFSVACAALSLLVLARISRRLFPHVHPAWLIAPVAVNPFLVWAAVEARPYALVVLLSALATLAFVHGFLSVRPDPVAVLGHTLAGAALLYTQYYGGFLLAAQTGALLFLLVRRRRASRHSPASGAIDTDVTSIPGRRQLLAYAASAAGITALFLPLSTVVAAQMSSHRAGSALSPSFASSVGALAFRLESYVLPTAPVLRQGRFVPEAWGRALQWSLRLGVAGGLAALGWRRRRDRREAGPQGWLIASALGLALSFLVLFHLVGPELVSRRHTSVAFLPVLLAAFSLVAASGRRFALAAWLALGLATGAGSVVAAHASMAKRGDALRVARYVMSRERPGEPVLVFPSAYALALRFHYSGVNLVVPLPAEPPLTHYDPRDFAIREAADLEVLVSSIPHRRLWLVTEAETAYLGVDFRGDLLEAFVRDHYEVEDARAFEGARVRWLVRR